MYAESVPALFLAAIFTSPWYLPPDASMHGPALDQHLRLNLWIALTLLILLHLLVFAGLALTHRGTIRTRSSAAFEYIPLALFTILFAWLTLHAERLWAATRYTGADPSALQVEVTGMQFAWYFRYPGPDATFGRTRPELAAPAEGNPLGLDPTDPKAQDDLVSSELVLPANREVDLRLHAQDVIHGFAIPELRIKQNAVPGMSLHIHFTPTTPGTYAILCTQLCGLGHFRMASRLRVVSQPDYQTWLAQHEQAAAR